MRKVNSALLAQTETFFEEIYIRAKEEEHKRGQDKDAGGDGDIARAEESVAETVIARVFAYYRSL